MQKLRAVKHFVFYELFVRYITKDEISKIVSKIIPLYIFTNYLLDFDLTDVKYVMISLEIILTDARTPNLYENACFEPIDRLRELVRNISH